MNTFLLSIMLAFSAGRTTEIPDECSPIDMRTPGNALEHLAPLSQGYGHTNLCGYFTYLTALDAINPVAELKSPRARIDVVGYAVRFAAQRDLPRWLFLRHSSDPLSLQFGRWGSSVCDLVQNGSEVPFCQADPKHANDADYQARLSDAVTEFYRELDAKLGTSYPGIDSTYKKEDLKPLYEFYLAKSAGFATPVSYSEFEGVLLAQPSKLYRIIETLFFKSCDSPIDAQQFAGLSCRHQLLLTEENGFRAKTDELLKASHPMPVPFAYCYKVVMEGKAYKRRTPLDRECRLHWSLVIGRRKKGDQCEYLVRNSSDPYDVGPPHWQNDRGDLWIDADTLARSAFLIQWLEDPADGDRANRKTATARRTEF